MNITAVITTNQVRVSCALQVKFKRPDCGRDPITTLNTHIPSKRVCFVTTARDVRTRMSDLAHFVEQAYTFTATVRRLRFKLSHA